MPSVLPSDPRARRRCSPLSFLSTMMRTTLTVQLSHLSQRYRSDGRFRINTDVNAVGRTIADRYHKSNPKFEPSAMVRSQWWRSSAEVYATSLLPVERLRKCVPGWQFPP